MIAIVGGGITGLAAASELARRGLPCVLLEASPRLGGIIQTEQVEGFTIEAGPDSVLAQKPAAVELFDRLGLGADVIATRPPRTAFVLKRGRLYPLPSPSVLGIPTTLSGVAGYRLLSPAARVRLALEPLVPRASKDDDESVGAFFGRRFGAATVGLVAEPLLGGIHAGDVGGLSMRSLFPRFVEAEAERGSVLHAFKGRPPGSGDGLFRSLAGGMSALVSAIASRLPPGGVQTRAPVLTLAHDRRQWRVTTTGGDVHADAVIVATPAHVASRLFSAVDADVSRLCAGVPYVSSASVALAWRRDDIRHPLAGSGFVVARQYNRLRVTACTWVSSKWASRAPEGMALLRVFIGGAHDPAVVDMSDDELVDLAVRDIAPVLGIRGAPALARVHRWRNAGAQHNVGQLARVAAIERALQPHPGLFVAGSGFRAVGIPDCIADGQAAAAAAATYVRIGTT